MSSEDEKMLAEGYIRVALCETCTGPVAGDGHLLVYDTYLQQRRFAMCEMAYEQLLNDGGEIILANETPTLTDITMWEPCYICETTAYGYRTKGYARDFTPKRATS